eukprot:3960552-Pyramimonas_sp.AAC.1
MITNSLAKLLSAKVSLEALTHASHNNKCDLVINGPGNLFNSSDRRSTWIMFKPDNHEKAHKQNAHFVIADNEYMDQSWQLKDQGVIRLNLVEDVRLGVGATRTSRSSDLESVTSQSLLLCYHGNPMHLRSLLPKLGSLTRPFKLRMVTKGAKAVDTSILSPSQIERIIEYDQAKIHKHLEACDVGLVPVEVQPAVSVARLAEGTEGFFQSGDTQPEDVIRRCKRTANAGRAFIFMQLGVPVLTDACPQPIQFSLHNGAPLALVAHRPEMWRELIERLFTDPRLRHKLSENSRRFAEVHLTTTRQAAKLLDRLGCHARQESNNNNNKYA